MISFERLMRCASNSIAMTNDVPESGNLDAPRVLDENVLRRIRYSKHNWRYMHRTLLSIVGGQDRN